VLDDVEAGRFLEHPAREDLAPGDLGAGIVNEDLDERAGLLGRFPRRGALAGGEADDHVAHAPSLARFHLEVLREVVALVEQADHGDALGHRRPDRRALRADRRGLLQVGRDVGLDRPGRRRLRRACGDQQRQERGERPAHGQASGLHAS